MLVKIEINEVLTPYRSIMLRALEGVVLDGENRVLHTTRDYLDAPSAWNAASRFAEKAGWKVRNSYKQRQLLPGLVEVSDD